MKFKLGLLFLLCCAFMQPLSAQKYTNKQDVDVSKEWKGVMFSSKKSITENLNASNNFSFLSTILNDSTITSTLQNEEMVTIFVATNSGFEAMSETYRDSIFANPKILKSYVTYHAVPGRMDSNVIKRAIKDNGGIAYFRTLEGTKLGAANRDGKMVLFDSENNTAVITDTDFYHKNGFFHIIDGVIFPKSEEE